MSPELFGSIFSLAMFLGVFIIYMGLKQRSQQLEMQHRERMAMIERGQIPLSDSHSGFHDRRPMVSGATRSSRSLSVGIMVVGLGLALMTIISIASESPEVGIGVGGAIAIIGGAFIAISLVVRPQSSAPSARTATTVIPPPPPDDRI